MRKDLPVRYRPAIEVMERGVVRFWRSCFDYFVNVNSI